VRFASRIERDWLTPERTEVEHSLDQTTASVRAIERQWYGRLVLTERHVRPDAGRATDLLVGHLREHGLGEAGERTLRRLRFAGLDVDLTTILRSACEGQTVCPAVDLEAWLPPAQRHSLALLAPETMLVPTGRRARLDYREDGGVELAVKLQELFGLTETPRLGPRGEPVTLLLLAPSGRPVQTTRDLRSFWERTYPEVRKELRGRYPKHPWPEDPWTAPPRRGVGRASSSKARSSRR
jgi:ATP-dependent helicase HrpB